MKISVIIPCYNEADNVSNIYEIISRELKDVKFEIIYIDDGSADNSFNEMKRLYQKDKHHIKAISFARNFNKEAAVFAGLNYADGDYVCVFSPSEYLNASYILEMVNKLEDNPEDDQIAVILKKEVSKSDKWLLKIINVLSKDKITERPISFRVMRKTVVDSILKVTERNRYSEGIYSWLGYKTKYIEVADKTGNNIYKGVSILKKWCYTRQSIVKHTTKPLLFAKAIGLLFVLLAFIYLIVSIIKGDNSYANAPVIIIIMLTGGLQFIALGIVGEYISQIYWETKNRPVYIIREKLGFEDNIL